MQLLGIFLALGNKQGDVYYVENESAGYVWINDNGTLRWELLGMTVDTSNFLTKSGLLQTSGTSTNNTMSQNAITQKLADKQPNLVSGTNIKTINNQSILGSGNILFPYINISSTSTIIGYLNNNPIYAKLVTQTITTTGTTNISTGLSNKSKVWFDNGLSFYEFGSGTSKTILPLNFANGTNLTRAYMSSGGSILQFYTNVSQWIGGTVYGVILYQD